MGFLTNQTTVIDAILTDEGRRRIAEGTFEITSFSLSDDEIVYSKAQQTDSSIKFYTTPIFESISENIRALKYNLLSMDGNYTHLTSTKLVVQNGAQNGTPQADSPNEGYYVIIATEATYNDHYQGTNAVNVPNGFIPGYSKNLVAKTEDSYIKIDHGVNDSGQDSGFTYKDNLPAELEETQFMVKLDYRLGRLVALDGTEIKPSFIDDDFIANYIITINSFPDHFETLVLEEAASPIAGARGKRMRLLVAAAPNVNSTSAAIWDDLGRSVSNFFDNGTTTAKVIDATLEVQGTTTSFNITIPLRFVKNA